jgi:diaminopimelate epimerase
MIDFYKYHGAGNDFIMIDQREKQFLTRESTTEIAHLCHRRFGIGADGLILLQSHTEAGVEMIYFNADGRESTLCGNGGRCFAAFAKHLGIADGHFHFLAVDGPHDAVISKPDATTGLEWVELKMNDVRDIEKFDNDSYALNTGSPHFVRFTTQLQEANMVERGREVRYSYRYRADGINVNLVEMIGNDLAIRTYERGVEDETLACGTGVTAAAIAFARHRQLEGNQDIKVQAMGGNLAVRLTVMPDKTFSNIWLCGPAQQVFRGVIPAWPDPSGVIKPDKM